MGEVRAKCYTAVYHSGDSPPKRCYHYLYEEMSLGAQSVLLVSCAAPRFALSPFSLATTSLPGKPLRSKIDLKVKHKRFPKGRGKINYDRWLFGLVLFWGRRGVCDPINKLFKWKGEVGDR